MPIFSSDCNFSNSQKGMKEERLLERDAGGSDLCPSVSMRRSSIGFTMGIRGSKRFSCLWQACNSSRMRKELVGSGTAFNLWAYPIADT